MRVGLFVTCLVDLVRPRIGLCAIDLLEGAGCEVVVPATQTCCGQPGYNSGDRKAAQALARKVLQEFASCEYVVVPSGSCGGMIKAHYPELLSAPRAEVRSRPPGCAHVGAGRFPGQCPRCESGARPLQGSVTYHDSCSGLRELRCERSRASSCQGTRAYPQGNGHAGPVLRIRWHLRREIRRYLVAHRRPEMHRHRQHRCRRRGAG